MATSGRADAATATVAGGLREIAAESSDPAKKAFAAASAIVEKPLGANSVETNFAKSRGK
ncbi:MAG: hypothetical protein ABR878_02930 [Roseiarcus sp.]